MNLLNENLLMRDNEDGAYQLVNFTPAGVMRNRRSFVAASADLNLVVFSERAKLTPDARGQRVNLYEWSEGAVRLLSSAPVWGSGRGLGREHLGRWLRCLLHRERKPVCARCTANAPCSSMKRGEDLVRAAGGSNSPAVSADGSQVFFTDDAAAGLTSDTAPGSGKNLYRYDVNTGQLSDLTPVSDAKAALAGISEDGSYVYFCSEGVQSGSQANQFGETAQNGQPNLYLEHDGTITFVMDTAVRFRK